MPHLDLIKIGKGRRKKKRLKGDMDAMRGYDEDMYGGGDFNKTRGRNLCSVCKDTGHKASRHRRQGQQVLSYCVRIAYQVVQILQCYIMLIWILLIWILQPFVYHFVTGWPLPRRTSWSPFLMWSTTTPFFYRTARFHYVVGLSSLRRTYVERILSSKTCRLINQWKCCMATYRPFICFMFVLYSTSCFVQHLRL